MTDKNIGNVRHDALRAQCVEMADKLDGDGTTLSDLLREAAEALAAPAEALDDPHTWPDWVHDVAHNEYLLGMKHAASVDVEGLRAVLSEMDEVEAPHYGSSGARQAIYGWRTRIRALIDSAGGAKGETPAFKHGYQEGLNGTTIHEGASDDFLRGYAAAKGTTPQPAGEAKGENPNLCPECKTWPVDGDACPRCGKHKPFTQQPDGGERWWNE